MRTSEASASGIRPELLYELVEDGILDRLQRGLYGIKDLPGQAYPDFVVVSKMIPKGVICLISALNFHGLTTQIPHVVDVAVPQGFVPAKVLHPPVRIFQYSESTLKGFDTHNWSGAKVNIFTKEKTVVDCFRHRSKVGTDVSIEALKGFFKTGGDINMLIKYAKASKVLSVMRPYIEMCTNE